MKIKIFSIPEGKSESQNHKYNKETIQKGQWSKIVKIKIS